MPGAIVEKEQSMTLGLPPLVSVHLVDGVDGAMTVRKRSIDVQVRFADRAASISTLEGMVECAAGDALVTGTKNEVWPVARAIFEQKYDAVAPTVMGCAGRYRTRGVRALAVRLTEPLRLALPAGSGVLSGAAGDWLLQYGPADQAIVDGVIFEDTYELFT